MAIKKLNPYLNFNGTAAKAIELYESALGAKIESLQRFGDVPGDKPPSPELKDQVMHALVRVGDNVLMISDSPHEPVSSGSNISICLDIDDPADLNRKFEALSAGGKITMPLQDTFWGARFGMLVDAYGVPWMFNCDLKKG